MENKHVRPRDFGKNISAVARADKTPPFTAERFNYSFPERLLVKQAIFFAFGNFFILISRRKASPLLMTTLVASRVTGLLDRVYFDAVPRLCPISLFLSPFVAPV